MKRPPTPNGSNRAKKPGNVVPLRIRSIGPKLKPKVPSHPVRTSPKRRAVLDKRAKSAISRIRPRITFGRRVLVLSVSAVTLLAIFVLVAVFSPLLAVREIEVVGAKRVSATAISDDLKSLKGKPLPQITSDEIAAKLSKYQLIDSVSAVSLPPSTLRVVVVERTALAIVNINSISYLYDAAGIQLGRAKSDDRLPLIEKAGNPATSDTFKQAVSVVLTLPVNLLPKVESILASSKDSVTLKLRSNRQSVLWGDASQPALKASVLTALMKHYEAQWGQTFDVSSPSQPSVF